MTTPSHVKRRTAARLGARANTVPKAMLGATSAEFTPLRVVGHGVDIDEKLRRYVAERLGRELGKYATRLTAVSVRFRDVSGPKGAPAKACVIRATVSRHGPAIVQVSAREPRAAFDAAAASMERTVRRLLERRRETAKR